jgi:MFS family permease
MALGSLSLARIDAETDGWGILWRLAVLGLGLGLFSSPNNSSVLGSVPRSRLGTASSTVAQMRITGQVLGVAVGGAILASRISDHAQDLAGEIPQQLVQRDALILSIHDALYFAAGACLIGVFASLVRGSRGDPTEDATTPEVSSGHNQRLLYLAERRE